MQKVKAKLFLVTSLTMLFVGILTPSLSFADMIGFNEWAPPYESICNRAFVPPEFTTIMIVIIIILFLIGIASTIILYKKNRKKDNNLKKSIAPVVITLWVIILVGIMACSGVNSLVGSSAFEQYYFNTAEYSKKIVPTEVTIVNERYMYPFTIDHHKYHEILWNENEILIYEKDGSEEKAPQIEGAARCEKMTNPKIWKRIDKDWQTPETIYKITPESNCTIKYEVSYGRDYCDTTIEATVTNNKIIDCLVSSKYSYTIGLGPDNKIYVN